jgi:hypothetical protein
LQCSRGSRKSDQSSLFIILAIAVAILLLYLATAKKKELYNPAPAFVDMSTFGPNSGGANWQYMFGGPSKGYLKAISGSVGKNPIANCLKSCDEECLRRRRACYSQNPGNETECKIGRESYSFPTPPPILTCQQICDSGYEICEGNGSISGGGIGCQKQLYQCLATCGSEGYSSGCGSSESFCF